MKPGNEGRRGEEEKGDTFFFGGYGYRYLLMWECRKSYAEIVVRDDHN